MKNVNENAKRALEEFKQENAAKIALEEFKQEKKNEANSYMQDKLNQINKYLVEENSKEQDEFVKEYINSSLRVLENSEANALEKYTCIILSIGAFQTYERYTNNNWMIMLNEKEEEPFQNWLVKFEDFINELIK